MTSQLEMELDQEGAGYRDHIRPIPYDPAKATGTAPYVSTPNDMGNEHRNAMLGWRDVTFPIGILRDPPKTPFMRRSLDGISPLRIFVRGPNDSVAVTLGAFGATRVSSLELSMLDGARALGTSLAGPPLRSLGHSGSLGDNGATSSAHRSSSWTRGQW